MMRTMITIATLVHDREPKFLRNLLHTLEHQTTPISAVVVDSGTKYQEATEELCASYDFVELIQAPRPFSLSWGINVGIKAANADYVMAIGSCMMLSSNYTEVLLSRVHRDRFISGVRGSLRESAKLDDVVADWEKLCGTLDPKLPRGIGSIGHTVGACFLLHRDQWLKLRGYNEVLRFAYADSCLIRRIKLAGLEGCIISFEEAQLLHQWHPKSPLISKLGGTLKQVREAPMVCNPGGWGEL